ncbi:MAG: acetate/propionate family kinase [Ferruginibacter sp.]|nr:acetate/propionate family kinase [Cytophagales bacterium]
MRILVINAGSSSVKMEVIDSDSGERILTVNAERVLSDRPVVSFSGESEKMTADEGGHAHVLQFIFPRLMERLNGSSDKKPIQGVGHRVTHGGERFNQATRIDEEVEQTIESLIPLAPLHNPINLEGIRVARQFFAAVPHVAVFDTAFHQTLPTRARMYALPAHLTKKYALRRYGFHGTSHEYVAEQAARFLRADLRSLRLITCHLGNGCSVAAIEYGRSIETSMGMTPLEGLVMGTRSGDLDPGLLLYLAREENLDIAGLDRLLNQESGLKGLTSGTYDMRDIIEKASEGDEACRLAIALFSHRLRKYIGAYAAVMGGVDAIAFAGGVGENSPVIRHRATSRLDFIGAVIDEDANRSVRLTRERNVIDFSTDYSRVKLLAVTTDEQYAIARQTANLIEEKDKVNTIPPIPIAVSARHVHLTQETVEKLFGPGYQLTVYKPLSQPGQFACNEQLTLVGPRNQVEHVRILGPVRSKNQVEISRTDEFFLGIDAPVRESGNVANSPGITLIGPQGKVELEEGVICAWRHIHMSLADADAFGVKDRDVVEVEVQTEERRLTFGDVIIRVSPDFRLEMHIDTDEGNAAEIRPGAMGSLVLTSSNARLKHKMMQPAGVDSEQ